MHSFAIWAAVSTKKQAEGYEKKEVERNETDKESIPNQIKTCRQAGVSREWAETSGPYVVAGKSRINQVNLRDAEMEIPELRQMLEDAKLGRFSVLVTYDYNRFRDLLDQVAKTLSSYGIQIASVNQWVDPLPAEQFSPFASDTESMMRGMSGIISRWQIADLRRKYHTNVSARVLRGLYSLHFPQYGYRKPPGRELDRKAIPIPDDRTSPIVLEIKRLFLDGASWRKILAHLTDMGYTTIHGKPWSQTTIRRILENPFYAGKVFFGKRRVVRDPRHNTKRVIKNPTPLIMDGKHKPLYSWEEYIKIQIELENRARMPFSNIYPFSRLLVCSVCGGRVKHRRTYWQCENYHVKIEHEKALEIIPPKIKKELEKVERPGIVTVRKNDPTSRLEELERQRKKVQQFAEREIYDAEEAEQRMREIKAQIAKLRDADQIQQKERIARENFLTSVNQWKDVSTEDFLNFFAEDDPTAINRELIYVIEKIEVTPEHKITIHLRY